MPRSWSAFAARKNAFFLLSSWTDLAGNIEYFLVCGFSEWDVIV